MDNENCQMCKENLILPLQLPCKHMFCFLCAKGQGSSCFICKMSFDKNLIEKPPSMDAVREGNKDKIRWYYESNNNGWWEFDPRTSDKIEDAFRQSQATVDFPIGQRTYEINFEAKRQYQQNDTGKKRKVTRSSRRDIQNLRGVAGVPLQDYRRNNDDDIEGLSDSDED
ncbi:Oidioi.mRNA.OKI2018_I69.chr2.g5925.t1.cds [Oikopleura dioica]|uniref:E3 ubiquitin-protein ligase n=1 Tax=Oikopleura dioica TaxID=34765 RepID=A0ABN7T524_OIKDI|nr:Oidioi.mRNA.OKI2018_I69.chr2.g5925.t1.cds [Oikopleura dioica]